MTENAFLVFDLLLLGEQTIRWLGEQAWRKYEKIVNGRTDEEPRGIQEIRKTRGGVILDLDDLIRDVLDDDDFVTVG